MFFDRQHAAAAAVLLLLTVRLLVALAPPLLYACDGAAQVLHERLWRRTRPQTVVQAVNHLLDGLELFLIFRQAGTLQDLELGPIHPWPPVVNTELRTHQPPELLGTQEVLAFKVPLYDCVDVALLLTHDDHRCCILRAGIAAHNQHTGQQPLHFFPAGCREGGAGYVHA
jgi:hypothetical protein